MTTAFDRLCKNPKARKMLCAEMTGIRITELIAWFINWHGWNYMQAAKIMGLRGHTESELETELQRIMDDPSDLTVGQVAKLFAAKDMYLDSSWHKIEELKG